MLAAIEFAARIIWSTFDRAPGPPSWLIASSTLHANEAASLQTIRLVKVILANLGGITLHSIIIRTHISALHCAGLSHLLHLLHFLHLLYLLYLLYLLSSLARNPAPARY